MSKSLRWFDEHPPAPFTARYFAQWAVAGMKRAQTAELNGNASEVRDLLDRAMVDSLVALALLATGVDVEEGLRQKMIAKRHRRERKARK